MRALTLDLLALPVHPPLLLMSVSVRAVAPSLRLMVVHQLATVASTAKRLALTGHLEGASLPHMLAHRHRAHTSLLAATNLQLVHEEAKRRDQLEQVLILATHNVHLVLLVSLLVDLLLEVESSRLLRLHESNEEVAALKEDL
mmetsp:Transcript_10141/g.13769  ORF Transcript_10141/g.13769 Transcript_10141/m.13769 type:complete len:143 (-) Transcript_10141:1302-1730(-)